MITDKTSLLSSSPPTHNTQEAVDVFFCGRNIELANFTELALNAGTLISKGRWGEVHRSKTLGKEVAVKKVRADISSDKSLEVYTNEIKILEHISTLPNREHIIDYYLGFWDQSLPVFIFELGDIELNKLMLQKSSTFTHRKFNNLLYQTLSMLKFLNDNSLYFGDFNFRNMVYFHGQDTIKLIDYGCCYQNDHDSYRPPLKSLSMLGANVFRYQFMAKDHLNKQPIGADECLKMITSSKDAKPLLDRDDLWMESMTKTAKTIITYSLVYRPERGEEVLQLKEQLSEREPLVDTHRAG
ncbi:hypothetical protein EOPP23_18165 [Endozoicomonas sp. OPT23]|uniref:protein kinase domain-containing protein n=1 Tax=Endozoicomonas sp. OPT23 TaxID=2072845 RepID=UPI00129AD9A5|nr:protein kinase [Endozoicomonas sp. OPT23]MRI34906.1 hypothetical protein [Endozoicomonas sp. OPT23]